jgi:hypothetical protein
LPLEVACKGKEDGIRKLKIEYKEEMMNLKRLENILRREIHGE